MEIEQPFDRQKNQRRAFIFITYESEEIVETVVANPKQTVGGREVIDRVYLYYTFGKPLRCTSSLICFIFRNTERREFEI